MSYIPLRGDPVVALWAVFPNVDRRLNGFPPRGVNGYYGTGGQLERLVVFFAHGAQANSARRTSRGLSVEQLHAPTGWGW